MSAIVRSRHLSAFSRGNFVCQPLDIEKVLRRDVVRRDVAAPSTAAQRHRRVEAGRHSDRPMRRRRVDDDAERRFLETELQNDLLVPRMNRHRVAHAAISQNLLAAFASLTPVLHDVPRQDRGEFFNRERIIAPDSGERGNQHARCGRDADAGFLGNERLRVGQPAPDSAAAAG